MYYSVSLAENNLVRLCFIYTVEYLLGVLILSGT